MKKNKLLLIIISAILILTPCYIYAEPVEGETSTVPEQGESSNNEQPTLPEEKTIRLDKTALDLGTEKEVLLKATVTPSDSIIEWSSDNESVATVDQNGKITTKKTAGTAKITATIQGTNISATCTVKVTITLGTDATLKKLTISNGSLDKSFDPNVTQYNVTVDSKVNSLKFTDLDKDLNDSNAGWQVTGNSNLKNNSVVRIIVTSEDKSEKNKVTKTYELTIIKDTVNLNLKSLKINGYALNESFDKDILEYTANIPYEIETISVEAPPEDSEKEVTISGLTNLKIGQNTVTVTVKDQTGNNKTYKIIVTRDKKVTVEENPTSIITSSNIITENNNSKNSITSNFYNNSSSDDFLKYAIVSLACLILFIIGGIGIYFYLKTSPKKMKKELTKIKKDEISPIIEVETEHKNQVNIEDMMQENLVHTKEFKKEELNSISKTENLFDDSEDV